MIPPSGTFREVIKELDFIIGTLRSRIIQLLPIHPTPTTYGRMGRFGSPFASLDFFSVDPAYAEFDVTATPLEQFQELVDAIHARNAKVFIDIPVNHTGWASRLQLEHPEWFVREADGTFVSPGAWGVTWEDLCKLDYKQPGVHSLMAEVFLHWCRHGVDGFRCDAGYMLPYEAWRYITAKVRSEYPDTVFFLEGLGGLLEVTDQLLGKAGLNWAYSELFQNYDRNQIGGYLPIAINSSMQYGLQVHFAETHDNNRLAAASPLYARMRTALCAMFSHNGAFGITNGVEWLASDKVQVHNDEALNWGAEPNLVSHLRRLHAILETVPAFHSGARVELIQEGHDNTLVMVRTSADGSSRVLILVNLNDHREAEACWNSGHFAATACLDLLSENIVHCRRVGSSLSLSIDPGAVLCLSDEPGHPDAIASALSRESRIPDATALQLRRATVLDVINDRADYGDVSDYDLPELAALLHRDPMELCRKVFDSSMPPVATWEDGRDQRRKVMLPARDMLLVKSADPFHVEVKSGGRTVRSADSMESADGSHFALLSAVRGACEGGIFLTSFRKSGIEHSRGELLFMHKDDIKDFRFSFTKAEARDGDLYALCANHLGGMVQARAAWGEVRSKYDALLAANLNPDFPVDRTVMFTRCRAWMVYKDYSQEINLSCLERFSSGLDNRARWEFSIPVGQGKAVGLAITLKLADRDNAIAMDFRRPAANPGGSLTALQDQEAVKIILRPDIEDRCNHCTTRAFAGPEHNFRSALSTDPDAFRFSPSGHHSLELRLPGGHFTWQPEWQYMTQLPFDANRGLEPHNDLFSPGYFEFQLRGGTSACLSAAVSSGSHAHPPVPGDWAQAPIPEKVPVEEAMRKAIAKYIVKRDDSRSVIAGYPWFLDWGRDTLICLRGMIAAGYLEETADIIKVFAGFERKGTLPNMIRGNDDSNRDTSDAPLWLFSAVRDYIAATGNDHILGLDCRGRSLLEVLRSIACSYIDGTPNGIRMDTASCLVFSPSHYTWMDTNHPAGTPREGYPVEIQALWHNALSLLATHDPNSRWHGMASRISDSINRLFTLPDGSLSDCLHAGRGVPAPAAVRDDACRPNQLFAVTLGAVTGKESMTAVVNACEQLLIPGAIRSLADKAVSHPLPVYRNGVLLNDPARPFWGSYEGDEDTRRKPAYHNGTAWTWPFPSFCEALAMLDGPEVKERALALLMSAKYIVEKGCPGHCPEILDGATPHQWRGCGAQAWGMTELYRVYRQLAVD